MKHSNAKYFCMNGINSMKLGIHIGIIDIIVMCAVLIIKTSFSLAGYPDLYFPPIDGKWETVSLEENGWNAAKLGMAMEYAGQQNSSGVVILYRGRILAEQYWKLNSMKNETSLYKYQNSLKSVSWVFWNRKFNSQLCATFRRDFHSDDGWFQISLCV